jgi:hypothetical protein
VVKDASGQGKHIYIWDCDADMAQDFDSLRPWDFMLGTQVKLIQVAKQKGRIHGVWYGGGEAAGRVTCLCELLVYEKGPHMRMACVCGRLSCANGPRARISRTWEPPAYVCA